VPISDERAVADREARRASPEQAEGLPSGGTAGLSTGPNAFADAELAIDGLRVSSRGRKDHSRRAEIQKWPDANGIDRQQLEWYADRESGTVLKRPECDRLQREILNGKIKCIILWELDRLSRRLRDGVNILADWAERGLKIVAVTQQLEFNGASGRTLAALLLGLAEIEWQCRKERQQAGIAVAKKKGVYKGRKPGTTRGNPERAVELKGKGLSVGEVATALGVSERTVSRFVGRADDVASRLSASSN
jgi:DNA invertase Pin-like site-specific DNA recombinase